MNEEMFYLDFIDFHRRRNLVNIILIIIKVREDLLTKYRI